MRALELGCYTTLCKINNAHKFLALKSAMTNSFKMNNFILAAHFCRAALDLESQGLKVGEQEVAKLKKYFVAFQKKGTNEHVLEFDRSASLDLTEINGYICSGTLKRISSKEAQCPFDK